MPDSVQHDDLHSGNVCWTGSAATARVIDWGDASWGCPLSTMLTTVSSVAHSAGVDAGSAEVRRLLDAYVEPFTRFASRVELLRWVGQARRTGCVGRALSWRAALIEAPDAVRAELEFPVRAWLLDLTDAPPD